jgi:hypothetical protein
MPANISVSQDSARDGGAMYARALASGPIIDNFSVATNGAAVDIIGPCEIRIHATEALRMDIKRNAGANAIASMWTFPAGHIEWRLLPAGKWNLDVKPL